MPKVARTLCGRPRETTKPKASPSQQREASSKDASACLGKNLIPCWLVHASLSTCQGMRIAVRMKCKLTPLHQIPQLLAQPLLIP